MFDRTKAFFAGVTESREWAQNCRSKDKRRDMKSVVLSLLISELGGVKYSSILVEIVVDTRGLSTVLENLISNT